MTFSAGWSVYDPANPGAGKRATVATPDDVDTLVTELADERAGAAVLEPAGGEHDAPRHILTAGVSNGYGYLSYIGDGYLVSIGAPESPAFHGDDAEYTAGSGIPIETLAAALKEYLRTGHRPTTVEWTDA